MKINNIITENYNPEYDDEAGMAQSNLYTIAKAAQGLLDTIDDRDNLPEWTQEKIAKVEGMLVTVWNYLQSQKAQGIDPQQDLTEFAPAGGGGSGDYFQALASAWYNGTFDTGSLQKGIKSQQDVERLLNRGIVCPDGKTRKLHIDYNSDFDGVEIYSDDYYEYGDHDDTIDSRTGEKWGPYDFMAFSDEDLSEGLNEFVTPQAVAQDPGLEREKDVDVIFFGKMPRDYAAETAWAALEEVLPAEYPPGSERAQEKVKEVAFQGGAVVTTKPLSVAKKLVATFNGYGIKSRVNGNLNEFAADDGNGVEEDALHKYAKMWWAGD